MSVSIILNPCLMPSKMNVLSGSSANSSFHASKERPEEGVIFLFNGFLAHSHASVPGASGSIQVTNMCVETYNSGKSTP